MAARPAESTPGSLIAAGLGVLAYGNYVLAHYNLLISPGQTITPQVIQRIGVSMIFVPLNTAAYLYLSPEQRLRATGLFNLLRNEGGSVGTSVSQTLLERRDQFHLSRLTSQLDPLNQPLSTRLDQLTAYFQQLTGDPAGRPVDGVGGDRPRPARRRPCGWPTSTASTCSPSLAAC